MNQYESRVNHLKENKKLNKPINYNEIINNFLMEKRIEKKYLIPLKKRIIKDGLEYIPEIRIELKDLDEVLLNLFQEKIESFLDYFKEVLYEKLRFFPEINEILEKFKIIPENLHIIFDCIDLESLIPEINDTSIDLTEYKGKLCRFIGRYLNIGLENSIEFKKMVFQCQLCNKEFETIPIYHKTREKYQTPTFCINPRCKAKSKLDFRLIEEKCEIFEKRIFTIGDIDINKTIDEKECVISNNITYFIEKVKLINLNEVIEVLGILHIDTADIYSRKDEQDITYYIEVLDLKPKESKIVDKNIIKELKNQIKKESDYCNEIIDSIHPYSKGIYDYFPIKLISSLAYITCDSWNENENIRNSLNGIIGGHTGTFKSRIGQSCQDILGYNSFVMIYGGDTTAKGLIPTAQRNNQEKNLVKRFGAFAYSNKKVLIVNEAQYLKDDAWECFKYLDDGIIIRALDGTMINASAKESVLLLLNYKTENEIYDYSKNLIENIGIPKEQLSILERFDLHYPIPKLKGKIAQILFRRIFRPINNVESKDRIYNYLFEAKRLYSEGIIIPQDLIKVIEELNKNIFQEKKTDKIISPREPIILTKIIKSISALRFKKEVDDSDIEYLKKHLINTIIPFQNNDFVEKIRIIDMNEIFRKTIALLSELYLEISITEHIDFMREFLESHYFPYHDSQIKDPVITNKINEYMPEKTGLRENKKYRVLLEDSKNIKYIEKLGYIIGIKNNKTHFINKKSLNDIILERIKEISEDNKNIPMEIDGVIQVLEIDMLYKRDLIIDSINYHIKSKYLIKTKENLLKLP